MPIEFYANVKLPHYGWFGKSFATKQEARKFIADKLRSARNGGWLFKPSYSGRTYYIRQQLMSLDV
jgi:hypothetical protein